MAIGIIRARNMSASAVGGTDDHNDRKYDKEKRPENIRENGFHESHYFDEATNLEEAIYNRIEREEVKGIRKDTNVAIEYVATINDPKVWDKYSPHGFFSNTMKWLEDKHGKGSVVAQFEHLDESNPHAHFVVVPVTEKEIKWKNQKGSGSRIEKRLNTRDFTGGRDKLRNLQDEYHKYLTDPQVGYEKKMGVKFYRGTKVEHQKEKYIQATDHKIGELRAKLAAMNNAMEKEELRLAIKKERLKGLNMKFELKEIKEAKKADKHKWKNKGTKYNKEIFHGEEKKPKTTKGIKKPNKDQGFSM